MGDPADSNIAHTHREFLKSHPPPQAGRMLEGQGWVENTSKSHGNLSLGSGAGEILLPRVSRGLEGHGPPHQGEPGAADPRSLTLAAGSVVAWGALVAVCSLEVGLAHAHPHPRVFATGVAFRPAGVAVTVWSADTQQAAPRRAVSRPLPLGRGPTRTGKELP